MAAVEESIVVGPFEVKHRWLISNENITTAAAAAAASTEPVSSCTERTMLR